MFGAFTPGERRRALDIGRHSPCDGQKNNNRKNTIFQGGFDAGA
jgi:hypothetical protein